MDFLLIVLAIGGLVFAGTMLVLASRTSQMQQESDARVQKLQAMATGSVLFAQRPIESAEGPFELGDDVLQPAQTLTFDLNPNTHPFVMTVPAGSGRVPGSFQRTPQRNRT